MHEDPARLGRLSARLTTALPAGPTLRDYAVFGICASFSILGVFMGIQTREWRMPLYIVSFFGLGAAVFVDVILRKRRDRNFQGDRVSLPGGVEIQLDMRRVWLIGGFLLYLGLLMAFVVPDPPVSITLIGYFLIAVGAVILIGHWRRLLPRRTLLFDPDGIHFGFGKFTAFIHWDNIAAVLPSEAFDNSMVLINLKSLDAVRVQPEASRTKFYREVAKARTFPGSDLSIMAGNFGVDGLPLAAALLRYAFDPTARRELESTRRIDGPSNSSALIP